MSAPRDSGELLDRVCRVLVDGKRAATEAMHHADDAFEVAFQEWEAAESATAREQAWLQLRRPISRWGLVRGRFQAFVGVVAEVAKVGVDPFSRAARVERYDSGASRGRS